MKTKKKTSPPKCPDCGGHLTGISGSSELKRDECLDCGYFVGKKNKPVAAPEAPKKFYRVTWTEKYEKVFEAENEDDAIENRDDEDAFQGCEESSAQEVTKCKRASPKGSRDCYGCDNCESGWVPVVAAPCPGCLREPGAGHDDDCDAPKGA